MARKRKSQFLAIELSKYNNILYRPMIWVPAVIFQSKYNVMYLNCLYQFKIFNQIIFIFHDIIFHYVLCAKKADAYYGLKYIRCLFSLQMLFDA